MKMIFDIAPLAIIAIILFVINFRVGGGELVVSGLKSGGKTFLLLGASLLLIFVVSGQAQALVEKYAEAIKAWMSGGKGLVGSYLAGIFSPGSLSPLPVVKNMWGERGI